jgi:hypothetical protein
MRANSLSVGYRETIWDGAGAIGKVCPTIESVADDAWLDKPPGGGASYSVRALISNQILWGERTSGA